MFPITGDMDSIGINLHIVSWQQSLNLIYPCILHIQWRDITQWLKHMPNIDLRCRDKFLQYRFQFRRNHHSTRHLCVIQRPLTYPVASDKHLLIPLIIQAESKHAAQIVQTLSSIQLIEIQNYFAIRIRCTNISF